jgi:hypothetical protein
MKIFEWDAELGNFTGWDSVSPSNATMRVVAEPHLGNYSGELIVNPSTTWAHAQLSKFVSMTEVYARAYFLFNSLPLPTNGRLWIIQLQGGPNNNETFLNLELVNIAGATLWRIQTRNGTSWLFVQNGAAPLTGEWHHVEVHWKMGNPGIVELFVDGVSIISRTDLDTSAYGACTRVRFGVGRYGSEPTYTFDENIDDVVIADTYVGPAEPTPPQIYTVTYVSSPISVPVMIDGSQIQSGSQIEFEEGTVITITVPQEVEV